MNFSAILRLFYLRISIQAISLCFIFLISSCKPQKKKVDVSQVNVNLKAQRFEEDLFTHANDINFLQNKYKNFFDLYTYKIVQLGTADTVLLKTRLTDFTNDVDIKNVYADSKKAYPDFTSIDEQLSDAFRHYKYYFPDKIIPKPVTFISGFNYGIVAADSILGIGLDMYLGDTSRYYPSLQFPLFKIRKMRKEYIVADAMKSWLQTEWEQDVAQSDLLSQMIYQGKILYALDEMMPSASDTITTGYTEKQLNWCDENEKNTWSFFIEHNLLFSIDQVQLTKYVNDGPTTNGFPKESPGNIAQWIGWKIVSSYMEKSSQISLQQLLNEPDYKKIFRDSKYKPKK